MTELCFAEFAKCLQSGIQPPNDDKDVVGLLLSWITDMPGVADKKGNPVNIAPSLVSDLLNRKVDVPKAIKNACTTKKIVTEAIKHCEANVIPYLNPIVSDDMFEAMKKAVETDAIIAIKKKKELVALLDSGKEAEFLGQMLIYVINRENRISNSPIVSDDIPLLAEADFECPICHAPLVYFVKNTPVKKYEVVKIYPDDISAVASEFALIPKPKRLDAPGNRMVLCRDHAEEYAVEPTAEDYFRLRGIKDRLSSTYSLRVDINDATLEDEIQNVLYGLAGITDDTELEELPLDALRLDQKILPENRLLKNDETTRVLRYYNFIDDLFSAMDRDGTGDFDLIASEIEVAYKKLDTGQLSQDEIVDRLAEWIKNKSGVGNRNMRACHIVVAYFIQNCEVFREISK